jgi:hypothetical protein
MRALLARVNAGEARMNVSMARFNAELGKSDAKMACFNADQAKFDATSQELKNVLIKFYCIKKCLLDLDPI